MDKTLVTIVALSIDTRHAVLYMADGETMIIHQGDARLPRIVEQSKWALLNGQAVTVDVTPIFVQRTEFNDAEKGTKGAVKFFRVAKSFLKGLVNTESPKKVDESAAHVSPLAVGVFPGQGNNIGTKEENESQGTTPPVVDRNPIADAVILTLPSLTVKVDPVTGRVNGITNDEKLDAARDRMHQLVGNSVGTDRAEFHAPLNEDTETIVAVHETSGAIIPDAQKLARQLRSAAKLQDYTGFKKFMERLASITDQRAHSAEDLMKFIEKGDLPIASDGCIVIFKRLNRRGKDTFVDVHTGHIQQKVGSYVFMRPGLVDPNRRQDCSNGLHVASLSYLSSFSGDVTVMAKVRPEDVFAVPEYNHSKMRVCGYHILAELPDNLRRLVNHGGSISSDPDGARLLTNVLLGKHVGITQHVEVGGHHGTEVSYKDVKASSADQLQPTAAKMLTTASTLDMKEALEAAAPVAPDIKAADLVQPKQAKSEVDNFNYVKLALSKPLGQKEKAQELYQAVRNASTFPKEQIAVQELLKFKKQARKSWVALGLPEVISDAAVQMTAGAKEPVSTKPVRTKVDKPTPQEAAILMLKSGLSSLEVAVATGLSKDQVYRLKKKNCA